jgi:putative SOS response-associated peptidase YedK
MGADLRRAPTELVARIHDGMPIILQPKDHERWSGPESDPHDVLAPFPAEAMIIWPVSRTVNSVTGTKSLR